MEKTKNVKVIRKPNDYSVKKQIEYEKNLGLDKNQGNWTNRILIGIPTTGLVRVEWTQAKYSQIIPTNWSTVEATHQLSTYVPLEYQLPDAENLMAKRVVEGNYEWFLSHEQDNILPPNTYLRLNEYMIEGKIPIISGLYYTKSQPAEPIVYRGRGNGSFQDFKIGDKIWADGIPMGLTIIHGSIIRALWNESEEYMVGNEMTRKVFELPNYNFNNTGFDNQEKEGEDRFSYTRGTTDLNFCLTGDTLIHGVQTKKIKDIMVGDKVYTHTGKLKSISKLFKRSYLGKLVVIDARRSNPIKITPNHEIYVRNKDGKTQWVPSGNIKKGDYVALPRIEDQSVKKLNVLDYVDGKFCPNGFKEIRQGNIASNLYKDGYSSCQIATAYGVDQKTISKILKKQGVVLRDIEESKRLQKDKELKNIELPKDYVKLDLRGESTSIHKKIVLTKDIMRFFGLYIAEGHSSGNHIVFSFGKHERDFVDFVAQIGKKQFGLYPQILEREATISVSFGSAIMSKLMKELFGVNALTKKIHPDLRSTSKPLIMALLRGYFEGDGHYHNKTFSATTISLDLAYTVKILLVKCGYHGRVRKIFEEGQSVIQGRIVNCHDRYVLDIGNGNNSKLAKDFEINDKIENGIKGIDFIDDDFFWVKVLNIKDEDFKGMVYNIEVEDDNTYLTEFIVHNCKRLMRDDIFKKAGWQAFQKKKYPFLVDTNILITHIDNSGRQYPLGGVPLKNKPPVGYKPKTIK